MMNFAHIRLVLLSCVVFALLSPVGRAVEFAGGTGEPNDPYLIETAEQLLAADITVPGTYFRLCRNIDLDRKAFTRGPFRAHLDGAGFEIQNGVTAMGSGIFPVVEVEGCIANLTLAGFDVGQTPWPDYPGSQTPVGGLTMRNFGTISNCGAIGWIATSRVAIVGGLVGANWGSIVNCWFDGWVGAGWEVRSAEDENIGPRVGGLAGYNDGSIANSFARGVVVGRRGVGGLVGFNNGTIDNCYATCTVIGDVGSGGLVSDNWGSLRHCYATGWVTGEMRGGLAGLAGRYGGTVIGCLWETYSTYCSTSGGGLGSGEMRGPWIYADNGWAGDPNWVINDDWMQRGYDYPRLSWEGIQGKPVPEPERPWLAGSGTQEDPYQITSYRDLDWLSTASVFWEEHFVLVKDIPYGPSHTIGICRGSAFAGTFDGNGHVIGAMRVDTEGATAWNLGVFGYVTGQVMNLTVENVHLASGPNSRWVGLLAGTCEGLIENCRATGSVTVGTDSQYIGGLVGYVTRSGEVVGCEADATIEAGEGSTDVGDLVGYQEPDMGRPQIGPGM